MRTFCFNFFLSNKGRCIYTSPSSTSDQVFRAYDRHIIETVTRIKYVVEYDQMWKWMVKFLSKFGVMACGIKIARFNSIRIAMPLMFVNILRAIPSQVTSSWSIVFFELNLQAYLT